MLRVSVGFWAVLIGCLSFSQTPRTNSPKELAPAVRNVTFENALRLPPEQQNEATRQLQKYGLDEAESFIRDAYAENGYWRPIFSIHTAPVSGSPRIVDLSVDVGDEGQQYWLRDLHFHGVRAFSDEQLVKLFPIQAGELSQRSGLSIGLEALKQLYGSNGYLNYTPIPEFDFDDAGSRVSITIEVDEGNQFHMGRLTIQGLSPAQTAEVRNAWPLQEGAVFDEHKASEFLKYHPPFANLSRYDPHLDETTRVVDVSLRYRRIEEGIE